MHARWSASSVRRLAGPLTALSFALLGASHAASQTLTVSGAPAAIKIITATAGNAPTAVSNALTTYTTSAAAGSPRKIQARLTSAMPAGVTLTINLAAVTGSVAIGPVVLTTSNQTVLTNITTTSNRTGAITYTVNATVAAGVVTSRTRNVSFTLVSYP